VGWVLFIFRGLGCREAAGGMYMKKQGGMTGYQQKFLIAKLEDLK